MHSDYRIRRRIGVSAQHSCIPQTLTSADILKGQAHATIRGCDDTVITNIPSAYHDEVDSQSLFFHECIKAFLCGNGYKVQLCNVKKRLA